jgi:hypothetical protein
MIWGWKSHEIVFIRSTNVKTSKNLKCHFYKVDGYAKPFRGLDGLTDIFYYVIYRFAVLRDLSFSYHAIPPRQSFT